MKYEIEFLPAGNGEKSGDAILIRWEQSIDSYNSNFFFYDFVVGLLYSIFLVLEYLMVRYYAKNSAERLAVNTLALASIK